ncbi:MAG: hypothetical protein JW966_16565 [Anaerolineae bacterium]|nr:hypothetical protein [Anaerolineae bacterium]
MHLDFLTPEVWNGLVIGVVLIGLSLAFLRLYRDLSRPINTRRKPVSRDEEHDPGHSHTGPMQGDQ